MKNHRSVFLTMILKKIKSFQISCLLAFFPPFFFFLIDIAISKCIAWKMVIENFYYFETVKLVSIFVHIDKHHAFVHAVALKLFSKMDFIEHRI